MVAMIPVFYRGRAITVRGTYQPGTSATNDDPGEPETFTMLSAIWDGVEISKPLMEFAQGVAMEIEEAALVKAREMHRSRRDEPRIDALEARLALET